MSVSFIIIVTLLLFIKIKYNLFIWMSTPNFPGKSVWCKPWHESNIWCMPGCISFSLASKASPADIRKVCVSASLRKLRTYDVDFLNDAWLTPPDATTLPMASSHHFTHPRQVVALLAPPMWCCAVPFLLPVREHPYSRLCTTLVFVLLQKECTLIREFCGHVNVLYIISTR